MLLVALSFYIKQNVCRYSKKIQRNLVLWESTLFEIEKQFLYSLYVICMFITLQSIFSLFLLFCFSHSIFRNANMCISNNNAIHPNPISRTLPRSLNNTPNFQIVINTWSIWVSNEMFARAKFKLVFVRRTHDLQIERRSNFM